jgi:hypothetical protein
MRNRDPLAAIWSRAWPLAAVLAVLRLGPACSSEGGGGGAPLRQTTLQFVPADGSTAQAAGVVDLQLSVSGGVDQALLTDVAGRLVFQTWPEGDAVAFGSQVSTDAPGVDTVTIAVTPQAALDDRWYLVKLSSVPPAVRPQALLEDGSAGTRFRPGSHPRVASIQICRNDASSGKLLVTFSEAVMFYAATESIVSLSFAGSASVCTQYGSEADMLLFTCGLPAAAATATVSVGAGVAGASFVAADPGSWTLGVTSSAGSCVELRPPPP